MVIQLDLTLNYCFVILFPSRIPAPEFLSTLNWNLLFLHHNKGNKFPKKDNLQ